LYGDWNINFMEDSVKLQELKKIAAVVWFGKYNNISNQDCKEIIFTLIVAIVINKQAYEYSSTILDLGYSDHLAQIININVNR
jgi:hypothetical protein